MGGRGAGSDGGGGLLNGKSERFIADSDGSNIDLGNAKLKYGRDDSAVTGNVRRAVVAQETKRLTAKVEHCQGFDANGNAVDIEHRGGHSTVSASWAQKNAEVFTHNHPREAGVLGGTFSTADVRIFTIYGQKTMRASAKEGTYSMTKGKNFDAAGTRNHCAMVERVATAKYSSTVKAIKADLRAGKISNEEARARNNRAFNECLVEMHNGYADGAKKYGYTYTLERRQK